MSVRAQPGDQGPIHLAIVHRKFLAMILGGTKTAEARLSKTRRLPYKGLAAGETVYFKPPGGAIEARAVASRVHRFEIEIAADLRGLRDRFDTALGGPDPAIDAYWEGKAHAAYATIIELASVEPIAAPAWYTPQNNRSAWRLVRPA